MRRFGRGHSAHARGDRPVKDGVRQREQRADLVRPRSRCGDDEHAAKAHQQRQPARQTVSLSSSAEASVANSGEEKLMAVAPASGIRLNAISRNVCEQPCETERST